MRILVHIFIVFLLPSVFYSSPLRAKQVFIPDYAGILYPKQVRILSGQVESFLNHARVSPVSASPEVILVPAGEYTHIGGLLADAYAQVSKETYDVIIILAPSVDNQLEGVSIFPGKYFRNLLGVLRANDFVAERLLNESKSIYQLSNQGFNGNYYIEVQLPFIVKCFGNIDILPLAIGHLDQDQVTDVVATLTEISKEKRILFVVSSSPESMSFSDGSIEKQLYWDISRLNSERFFKKHSNQRDAFGLSNSLVLGLGIELAESLGATTTEIFRMNNDIDIGGSSGVVRTYVSAGFYFNEEDECRYEPNLNQTEIKYLLHYTYYLVQLHVDANTAKPFIPKYLLDRNLGVQVSIFNEGKQIGSGAELFSNRPIADLLKSSIDYALFSDPVMGNIDVSILTDAMLKLTFVGRAKRIFPQEYIPEDGLLYLTNGTSSSMTLCKSTNIDDIRIYRHLCLKAGLLYNCYDDDETEIYHFKSVSGSIVLEL